MPKIAVALLSLALLAYGLRTIFLDVRQATRADTNDGAASEGKRYSRLRLVGGVLIWMSIMTYSYADRNEWPALGRNAVVLFGALACALTLYAAWGATLSRRK